MGLFTGFKKARLEKKFIKNEWVIIQSIPFAQFEQLIVNHVDDGWEIEDDYLRLQADTPLWQCILKKGTSILTCVWSSKVQGQVYGPERVLNDLTKTLNLEAANTIDKVWF